MGYRSEVAYLIEFEDREQMEAFVATQMVAGNVWDINDLKMVEVENGGWMLTYHAESVKWYDDYKDVQKHEALVREAMDLGYKVEFVRIGEDEHDIEIRNSTDLEPEYRMEVIRYVGMPHTKEDPEPFSFTKKEADEQPRAGEQHQRDVA